MKQWWQARNERERAGVIGATALSVLLALWQLAVAPLIAYRASTAMELVVALEQATESQRLAHDIVALRTHVQSTDPSVDSRTAVTTTARELDIEIARMQPSADQGIELWIEQVDAPRLYRWLATLHTRHGISTARISVSRIEKADTVRVQVTLAKGPST